MTFREVLEHLHAVKDDAHVCRQQLSGRNVGEDAMHEATNELLSHVPFPRYTVPSNHFPLTTFRGILHAHQIQLVEWLKHAAWNAVQANNAVKELSQRLPVETRMQNLPAGTKTFTIDVPGIVDTTLGLISHVPDSRYTVPNNAFPLNELPGQLHALHINTLEWLKHISSEVERNRALIQNCCNQSPNDSTLVASIDNLRRSVDELRARPATDPALNASVSSLVQTVQGLADMPRPQTVDLGPVLDQIQAARHELNELNPSEALRTITRLITGLYPAPAPEIAEPEADLPNYVAQHPDEPCRTHGVLRFDDVHSRIPMDLLGSRPSTSLELRIKVTRLPHETKVTFALYESNALLLSRTATVQFKLASLPGDALAVVHANCPQFIYKLNRAGLC